MSGVAVGEGLEGNGDASAGGFSFNEDGTRINESKESLAGVALASARVKSPSLARASAAALSALLQMRAEGALDRCSEMSVRPFFFGSAAADACSNLPCTMIPDSRLETV